ncbi:MAG: hypothetical protein GY774_17850 [Planctomycetes bacterium]|nr:hypothetical protein [Planctomycetota bacterium]
MKKIESNSNNPYPVYFNHVESLAEVGSLEYPSRFFTLLLCVDFERETVDSLSSMASSLADRGNVYFCAWGPGCKQVHDVYDESLVEQEIEEVKEHHVMTTWHNDEPLEEVLWFTLFSAMVEDEQWDDCSSVIITAGNNQWRQEVEDHISNISAFNEQMTKDA